MLGQLRNEMEKIVEYWLESKYIKTDNLFVIGCSTSEVAGEHIGTAGSSEIASVIYEYLQKLNHDRNIHLAFQCCEHLNRALVIEKSVQEQLGLEDVSVIPVPEAGGSMASYAYKQFTEPVVVEEITAHAGIDIGDTMIGMHLKKVAIPLRMTQTSLGHAHVTAARTRPKLIGGERATYKRIDGKK